MKNDNINYNITRRFGYYIVEFTNGYKLTLENIDLLETLKC